MIKAIWIIELYICKKMIWSIWIINYNKKVELNNIFNSLNFHDLNFSISCILSLPIIWYIDELPVFLDIVSLYVISMRARLHRDLGIHLHYDLYVFVRDGFWARQLIALHLRRRWKLWAVYLYILSMIEHHQRTFPPRLSTCFWHAHKHIGHLGSML